MAAVVAAKSAGMALAGKKLRKPYTITNPRQKWTADEHDRFLHALLLHGRDWKRIQACVATKTATQIRSHAQKHFLRAQKMGLAVPPVHPRRAGAVRQAQPPSPISWVPSFMDDDDASMSTDDWTRRFVSFRCLRNIPTLL
jgi:SHAQKYF class myb-like DNA-binding protein